MNFTQSFEEFSKGLGPTDLVLYAGLGLFLWVLFKDKLSPVQNVLSSVLNKVKTTLNKSSTVSVSVPETTLVPVVTAKDESPQTDPFFKLIVSWKQTRDLAEKCGCGNAVEVADSMFPYLSPNVCGKDKTNV